jgi:hypothetical protein
LTIRSIDDAKAQIGHHFDGLQKLGKEVHMDFMRDCRVIAPVMTTRTRASLYRDMFIRKLRDYCDETKGAHFFRKSQLDLICLESRYAMRVKRLTDGFSVGVSPTLASEQYDKNELPEYVYGLFPGVEMTTLLYLGWSVPENAPGAIELYLVCNDSNRNVLWAIALSDHDDGRGIQQPLPIEGDSDEGVGIRIRVKGEERKHG